MHAAELQLWLRPYEFLLTGYASRTKFASSLCSLHCGGGKRVVDTWRISKREIAENCCNGHFVTWLDFLTNYKSSKNTKAQMEQHYIIIYIYVHIQCPQHGRFPVVYVMLAQWIPIPLPVPCFRLSESLGAPGHSSHHCQMICYPWVGRVTGPPRFYILH